jgi:hypothetical protein
MKHLKILGLALVTAAALTASFGAGSASATELCKTPVTPCPDKHVVEGVETQNMYLPGTHMRATTTKLVLTTSITTITCTSSTIEGEITNTGGATTTAVSGKTTALTLTGCTRTGGEKCTMVSTSLGTFSITGGAASSTAKFNYNIISKTGWNMTCGFFINCTFSTSSATLAGQNQSTGMPTVKAENIALAREGGLCPETSTLSASYEITEPTPLYVV